MIEFEFDVVGGPFDGAEGLHWRDDGKHPPPERIFLGVCRGTKLCGMRACRQGVEHVAFWTPDEETRPPGAVAYRKQDEYVVRVETTDELHGHAVYAIGGLLDPRNFGALAQVPEGGRAPVTALARPGDLLSVFAADRELLPAGRHDRGWPRS